MHYVTEKSERHTTGNDLACLVENERQLEGPHRKTSMPEML